MTLPGMGPMQLLYIHACVPRSIYLKLFGYNCVCAVVVILIVGWRVFKGLINKGKNELKKKELKFKSAIIQVHATIIVICTVLWNIQRCYAMDHGEGYYGKHEFLNKDRSKNEIIIILFWHCAH